MELATKDFGNYLVDGEPEMTKGGEVQHGGGVDDDSLLRDAVDMIDIGGDGSVSATGDGSVNVGESGVTIGGREGDNGSDDLLVWLLTQRGRCCSFPRSW